MKPHSINRSSLQRRAGCLMLLMALALLCANIAMASAGSGGGLPYEDNLTSIRNSVTGPVAFTFAIIGIVGAGCGLIFAGQEINGFLRVLIYLVLVISFVIGAQNIVATWGKGASIAAAPPYTLQA